MPFLRDFNRGAAHNELGMQAVEIVGDDVDGDFDGVNNELTIGDMTALAVYMAAQPRPTTLLELNSLGLLEPRSRTPQIARIARGAQVVRRGRLRLVPRPGMTLNSPIFSEPSQNAAYRDGTTFPAGQPIGERRRSAHPGHVRPDARPAGQHHHAAERQHLRRLGSLHGATARAAASSSSSAISSGT